MEDQPKGLFTKEDFDSPCLRPFNRLAINFECDYPSVVDDMQTVVQFVPGGLESGLENVVNGQYLANYIPRQSDKDRLLYTDPGVVSWLQKGQESEDVTETERAFTAGMPKTFAHLAVDSLSLAANGKPRGHPMLAVLKADVDRLGFVFSRGLGKKLSVGRYATLSRQLDLFFRGYLTNLLANPPAEQPDFANIYTVYAGGDDLLLVGPWRTVFNFAGYLQKAFSRYVAENEDVTISASLAVMRHSFPLAQAVARADELLDRAKHAGRNRIGVFNTILQWPDFEQAIDDSKWLDRAINDGADGVRLNKGFVYRLLKDHQK